MAARTSTTKSNYHMKALGVLSMLMLIQKGVLATQFTVGDKNGWTVPSDNSAVYNQWAEKSRFQVGDSLLFNYQPGSDSVLLVTKEDYEQCNTASPIKKFTDGHTVFKFVKSGPHYFISGNKDNCQKNEKLVLVVMADRTSKRKDTTAPAASPPAPAASPPAPTAAAPAPNTSSLSPPMPSVTPAPSTEYPADNNNNGASGISAMSFIGGIGAFVGCSMILGF